MQIFPDPDVGCTTPVEGVRPSSGDKNIFLKQTSQFHHIQPNPENSLPATFQRQIALYSHQHHQHHDGDHHQGLDTKPLCLAGGGQDQLRQPTDSSWRACSAQYVDTGGLCRDDCDQQQQQVDLDQLEHENFLQVPGPRSLQLMKENDRLQVKLPNSRREINASIISLHVYRQWTQSTFLPTMKSPLETILSTPTEIPSLTSSHKYPQYRSVILSKTKSFFPHNKNLDEFRIQPPRTSLSNGQSPGSQYSCKQVMGKI